MYACLRAIFERAPEFGGGLFALAASVMADLTHHDPLCFPGLDAAGLPEAFIKTIKVSISLQRWALSACHEIANKAWASACQCQEAHLPACLEQHMCGAMSIGLLIWSRSHIHVHTQQTDVHRCMVLCSSVRHAQAGVLPSGEAVCCVPTTLVALCLNQKGLKRVEESRALECLIPIFTTPTYLRALQVRLPDAYLHAQSPGLAP